MEQLSQHNSSKDRIVFNPEPSEQSWSSAEHKFFTAIDSRQVATDRLSNESIKKVQFQTDDPEARHNKVNYLTGVVHVAQSHRGGVRLKKGLFGKQPIGEKRYLNI